ncbi:MAG: hypothetical protein WAT71_11740 [Ignavibacteria bacterium]
MKINLSVFLILMLALIFSSCNLMKKNVMEDNCDDVEEVVIAKSSNGFSLIIREEIFQAQSKSDNNGIRQITGYTEYRISDYDLNTGEILKRIELGTREEGYCHFLGQTDGKLWYKSVNPDIGFHAKDPGNLEIIVSEKMIMGTNPFLSGNISKPDWISIHTFYGFDAEKNMPMISDNSGYLYFIDPITLKAEKTSESVKNLKYDENPLTNSIKADDDSRVSLKGDPRNTLDYKNKNLSEPSFLKGEILLSSMKTDFSGPGIGKKDREIITDENSIFILSQTDVTDKAKIIISKVKLNEDGTVKLQWESVLDNIFRDPDKGLDRSSFDMVFSKGHPKFNTMRVTHGDNKLVFVFMLKATCIDSDSGKILWSRDL